MVQVWFTLVQQPEPRLTLPSPTPPHPANFCPLLLSQGNDPEEPKGVTSEGSGLWPWPRPAPHPLLWSQSPLPASLLFL